MSTQLITCLCRASLIPGFYFQTRTLLLRTCTSCGTRWAAPARRTRRTSRGDPSARKVREAHAHRGPAAPRRGLRAHTIPVNKNTRCLQFEEGSQRETSESCTCSLFHELKSVLIGRGGACQLHDHGNNVPPNDENVQMLESQCLRSGVAHFQMRETTVIQGVIGACSSNTFVSCTAVVFQRSRCRARRTTRATRRPSSRPRPASPSAAPPNPCTPTCCTTNKSVRIRPNTYEQCTCNSNHVDASMKI